MSTRPRKPMKGHEPRKPKAPQIDPKAVAKFKQLMRLASDDAGLAAIYVNDGALLSGARLYSKASTLLQQAHEIRSAALGAPVN